MQPSIFDLEIPGHRGGYEFLTSDSEPDPAGSVFARARRKVTNRPWRVLSPIENFQRRPPLIRLPQDIHTQFLGLAKDLNSNQERAEAAIIEFANRYGALNTKYGALMDGPSKTERSQTVFTGQMVAVLVAKETVEYWKAKVDEIAEATKRRQEAWLDQKHLERISNDYIGPCDVTLSLGDGGATTLTLKPRSLLSAIWLQWSHSALRFRGYCVVCKTPLFGRSDIETCSPMCRRKKRDLDKK